MQKVAKQRGLPKQIRDDNGPEFLNTAYYGWSNQNYIFIKYIQPSKLLQYADMFDNLEQVRILSDKWVREYNNLHPHKSLNGETPNQMVAQLNDLSKHE